MGLSELTTNLIPYPRLHFLAAATSPLAQPRDVGRQGAARGLQQVRGMVQALLMPCSRLAGVGMLGSRACKLNRGRSRAAGGAGCAVSRQPAGQAAAQAGGGQAVWHVQAAALFELPCSAPARTSLAVNHPGIHAPSATLCPQHTYLACSLLARGGVEPSDLSASIAQMRRQMRMPQWNPDAFKTGICRRPPVGERAAPRHVPCPAGPLQGKGRRAAMPICTPRHAGAPFSLLCLANNCGMGGVLGGMHQRFSQLYRRRLYVHHYEEYIEAAELEAAQEAVAWLADAYRQLDSPSAAPDLARLRPQEFGGGGGFGRGGLQPSRGR